MEIKMTDSNEITKDYYMDKAAKLEARVAELEKQLEQLKINPDSANEIINLLTNLSIDSTPPAPAAEEVAVAGATEEPMTDSQEDASLGIYHET